MSDLQTAYSALEAKAPTYDLLWRYYNGDQPLVYSSARLYEVFGTRAARFIQNWCSAVVNATMDRLNLTGFVVDGDDSATELLNELFVQTELQLDSDAAHLAALVCGESFVIVWPNMEGGIDAYYNDPRIVHCAYDPENTHRLQWAAKRWVDAEGLYRMTLYYPERLEYYISTKNADAMTSADDFELAGVASNPYGAVPVFHLRTARSGLRSELQDVVPIQDAINKLFADMMVSAEYGAFRQRWVITNGNIQQLKNAPNKIWEIPAGDGVGQQSQVGEFEQVDLSLFLNSMDNLASKIGVITRTPKHYLWGQSGDPSGEALIAMEHPLVRKVERLIEIFSVSWQQIAAFMASLRGVSVDPLAITVQFDPVETQQPLMEGQTALLKTQVGVSKRQVQREMGYTEAQIDQMEQEKEEQVSSLGEGLLAAFDRGEDLPED